MNNDTVKETWIDKLVDELVDAKNEITTLTDACACYRAEKRALEKANNTLIDTILDNTRLDYDGNELRIDSDTALIYLLKIEYPDEYRERLEELKTRRAARAARAAEIKASAEAAATEEEA